MDDKDYLYSTWYWGGNGRHVFPTFKIMFPLICKQNGWWHTYTTLQIKFFLLALALWEADILWREISRQFVIDRLLLSLLFQPEQQQGPINSSYFWGSRSHRYFCGHNPWTGKRILRGSPYWIRTWIWPQEHLKMTLNPVLRSYFWIYG